MNEMINASEMITRVFRNIEAENIEGANKISSIWSKVVRGIKNSRDEFYGEKIDSHSDVIDFKNGQLLIEADHPGWIQAMQLYSKFIIRGMNMNMPGFKVDTLVFRLKGNNSLLFNSYEEELKKAQEEMNRKNLENEKKTENFLKSTGVSVESKEESTDDLPAEFLASLSSLQSTILTNSEEK